MGIKLEELVRVASVCGPWVLILMGIFVLLSKGRIYLEVNPGPVRVVFEYPCRNNNRN